MDIGLKFPKLGKKKKRKKHSNSILNSQKGTCFLCGKHIQTEEHHIFGGANRSLSEEYGLEVHLCMECHRTGKNAVHSNKNTMDYLHRIGQEAFERRIGSKEEFMKIFGRNYLWER